MNHVTHPVNSVNISIFHQKSANFAISRKFCYNLQKIKVFGKKDYDVIILVNEVNNKVLSRDSNYTVDVVT